MTSTAYSYFNTAVFSELTLPCFSSCSRLLPTSTVVSLLFSGVLFHLMGLIPLHPRRSDQPASYHGVRRSAEEFELTCLSDFFDWLMNCDMVATLSWYPES